MDHFHPDRNHLRHVILFLFLFNLKVPEFHLLLVQVYKAEALHENTIRFWFRKFENRDFSLDDASRSGLSVWWSVHGVHHWKLLDEGKTITAEYYSAQLQKGNIIKAHNPEHEEKKVQLQKCDTPKKNEMKGKIKGDKKQQNVAAGAKNANDGLVTFGNKDMIQERNPEAMTKSKRKKAIMALETQEEFV
uniref:HTH_48 domain-containing protein n=1 Tax=Caenorhabditis japonica TaxID=281687 RepID=A0A8R1I689_CAEJA